MSSSPYKIARKNIDTAHSQDPSNSELAYADGVESWVVKLHPDAPPILRLAARCQHLERWNSPRSSYPEGKAGYLKWRRGLYTIQADRAREILLESGVSEAEANEVHNWVSKKDLKKDPGSQALEDAAILTFFESEIKSFSEKYEHFDRTKWVDIVKKTWRKLSDKGKEAAKGIHIDESFRGIVEEAMAQ